MHVCGEKSLSVVEGSTLKRLMPCMLAVWWHGDLWMDADMRGLLQLPSMPGYPTLMTQHGLVGGSLAISQGAAGVAAKGALEPPSNGGTYSNQSSHTEVNSLAPLASPVDNVGEPSFSELSCHRSEP